MSVQSTLDYLDALYQNMNPITGHTLPNDSVFQQDQVRYALANFRATLHAAANPKMGVELTDEDLKLLCQQLRQLQYAITPTQLLHICRGSRRIVDPNLKALDAFGRFRSLHTKPEIERRILQFRQRHPLEYGGQSDTKNATASTPKVKPSDKPWKAVTFFEEVAINQLSAEKSLSLQKDVWGLGIKKPNAKLPAYQQKARERFPRSYEPWTKAEKALLLEAMCYTNQLSELVPVFGRGERSVKEVGQRLIWESRQRHRD